MTHQRMVFVRRNGAGGHAHPTQQDCRTSMHANVIVLILVAALIGVRIYLRVRRAFGRQRVHPRRLMARVALFALFGLLAILLASPAARTWVPLLAGGACGAVLGRLGLRHTRFESTPQGRFYTPHTYLGLTVTVAFLVWIVYDYLAVYHQLAVATAANPHGAPMPPESPLTFAISGAFIAYYFVYALGVLRRSRQSARTPPASERHPD